MKQAYLVIAHQENYVLEKLIEGLDNPNHDIFIHIDKKNKNFDFNRYNHIAKFSNVFFLKKRIEVRWGGFEQVEVELLLLKEAIKTAKYSYFHLLSGQDLPIKNSKYIFNTFDKDDKIYVDYEVINPVDTRTKKIYRRASVKRILLKYRQNNTLFSKLMINIDRMNMLFQEYLLRRNFLKSKGITLLYGSQWFSIPKYSAEYLIDNEEKIRDYFKDSYIPDELFLQTVLFEKFEKKFASNNKRLINFKSEGKSLHPYVWRNEDYTEIINSDRLFARKFDERIDSEIIDRVSKYIRDKGR